MRNRWFGLFAVAALLAALWPTGVEAKPPAGGGTGGGTIYFNTGGALWSMNSDGSGKTQLAVPNGSEPSRALHGGQRWFLEQRPIAGETYPDGGARVELFAVRGDGNAAFTTQLTDQADLQAMNLPPVWTPGDAAISWVARRWSGGDVAEGGIYVAAIVFDAGGNVTGLAAQPSDPAVSVDLVFDPDVGMTPDLNGHDWSPDGTRAVFGKDLISSAQGYEVWITDGSGDQSFLVAGVWPQWSPDGSKIAYGNSGGGGVSTISPDGSGADLIVGGTAKSRVYFPHWSPTGSHVAYIRSTGSVLGGDFHADVYRATAAGGSRTNLTGDIGSADLVAWR